MAVLLSNISKKFVLDYTIIECLLCIVFVLILIVIVLLWSYKGEEN